MRKMIIINAQGPEIIAAIIENNKLVELHLEREHALRIGGNIYLGKVQNVLPGMQAAFVDIGLERNAFLYLKDALPQGSDSGAGQPIINLIRPGQAQIVQVTKEVVGRKGARVTTHLSLPGRYLVMMPGVEHIGVSRKIDSRDERQRLKEIISKILPAGNGAVIRTAAMGIPAEQLELEVIQLNRSWQRIQNRAEAMAPPALLHRELELLERIVRDHFRADVQRLVVNDHQLEGQLLDLVDEAELRQRVEYKQEPDLIRLFGIQHQLDQALQRQVWLKSGGYLIFDTTEALTVIDVNTGKYVGKTDLSTTILKTNLEAAEEIARQLRLRNIGGIIIIDLITMDNLEHRDQVLAALEQWLANDPVRTHLIGLTGLGLVEITRKKHNFSLEQLLFRECPNCGGLGKVLTAESIAYRTVRELYQHANRCKAPGLMVEAHPQVAGLLIGNNGNDLNELEQKVGKQIIVRGIEALSLNQVNIQNVEDLQAAWLQIQPVRTGQVLTIIVEKPHISNPRDGIARVEGFVVNIEDAGQLVGQTVEVEILAVNRTFARARVKSLGQST